MPSHFDAKRVGVGGQRCFAGTVHSLEFGSSYQIAEAVVKKQTAKRLICLWHRAHYEYIRACRKELLDKVGPNDQRLSQR